MLIDNGASLHAPSHGLLKLDPGQIVFGLHWDPPQEDATDEPDDLDALCVLLDAQGRVAEVIHPGNPRNAGGSVIHTGDSRTGASTWDDERIFVFLEALPATITQLAFVVASATGRPLNEVRGAACHVTDHVTERELVCLELTAVPRDAHCVATLYRNHEAWEISASRHPGGEFLAQALRLVGNGKAPAAKNATPQN